ncbi:MAG: hypothetical protein MK193_09430 [Lentisphaeria bacterium]|nr:hypothetical protein [Lentisphaeria bacterium]
MKLRLKALLGLSLLSGATHAQAQTAWDQLPDNTVVAARMFPAENMEPVYKETKYGKYYTDNQIIRSMFASLEELMMANPDTVEGASFIQSIGLSQRPFSDFTQGETGLAIMHIPNKATIAEVPDGKSAWSLTYWFEPKEDLSTQVMGQMNEMMTTILGKNGYEPLEVGVEGTAFAHSEELNYVHVSKVGNRIQAVVAFWPTPTVFEQATVPGTLPAEVDQPATPEQFAVASKQFMGLVERIHNPSPSQPKFNTLIEQDLYTAQLPGVKQAEVVYRHQELVKALPDNVSAVTDQLGLNKMKGAYILTTYEKNIQYQQMLVSIEEYDGLLKILNQPSRDLELPSWIPSNFVSYTSTGFNVKDSYKAIYDSAQKVLGFLVAMQVQQVNQSLQSQFMVNLDTIINSIGDEQVMVNLGIIPKTVGNPADPNAMTVPQENRLSAVKFKKESYDLIHKGLQVRFGVALEATNMDGVEYYTIPNVCTYLYADNYLFIATDKEPVNQLIKSLNGVGPDGTAKALKSYANVLELLPPTKNFAYSLGDQAKEMQSAKESLEIVNTMLMMFQSEEEDINWGSSIMDIFNKMIPPVDQLQDMFGKRATRITAEKDYIVLDAVAELP